jgi:hypothetical protein
VNGATDVARRLLEDLTSRGSSAFDLDLDRASAWLLSVPDRLLAGAATNSSAAQSMAEALAWTQRSIPEQYQAAFADLGEPPYDPAWDSGKFQGFGYALASGYLYLDQELADQPVQQAIMDRLDRPAILLRAVSGGIAYVGDDFLPALALETAREQMANAGLADQLIQALSSLDLRRAELELRAQSWERQLQDWSRLRGPAEPWRDVVITITTHGICLLKYVDCNWTQPGPGPGPQVPHVAGPV